VSSPSRALPSSRPAAVVGSLLLASALLTSLGGCHRRRWVRRAHPKSVVAAEANAVGEVAAVAGHLGVSRALPAPLIDGEVNEPVWPSAAARSGAFLDDAGKQARPYSDARFLWSDGALDLVLYAADEDVEAATDMFTVVLIANGKRATYQVGPKGLVAAANRDPVSAAMLAGAKFGVDLDGTPDAPDDDDEEWVIESSLPLAPLGLVGKPGETLQVAIERCDTPKKSVRACAHFGTESAPKTLVLR
jgi:hypothetical protein